jgi:hypothetical protein
MCEVQFRLDFVTHALAPPADALTSITAILAILLMPFVLGADAEVLPMLSEDITAEEMELAAFAQTTYSEEFGELGLFSGQLINDVAGAIESGELSPASVPINIVIRDGNALILNTRSAQALIRAGIPRGDWAVVNRTGDDFFEALLDGQLARNGLDSVGTFTVRSTG